MRARLTYANVMSTLAVLIALGGTSYAAIKLPAKSVGTKQIKPHAVTDAKVKRGTLTATAFQPGSLPKAPKGTVVRMYPIAQSTPPDRVRLLLPASLERSSSEAATPAKPRRTQMCS